jgi:hypothetical protein
LTALAFDGLLPHIKDKFSAQEFESLSHMMQRMSNVNVHFQDKRRAPIQKKVSFVDYSSSSDEEAEVDLPEWTKNKKLISCPYGKREPEKFGFDITKADKIFDLLLQEGQIKLSANHVIPSVGELKNKRYCKWHKSVSHDTNDCKIFRQEILTAIQQGRLKFEVPNKTMKIEGHPFPTNEVEINKEKEAHAEVMSPSADKERSSAGKSNSRYEHGEGSARPQQTVSSQMLLKKYQCHNERMRRFQE